MSVHAGVETWPHVGERHQVVRVLRDGRGIECGPVCPRCRAHSYRKVAMTAWRHPRIGRQAHCTRCRIAWSIHGWCGIYACYWGPSGPDWHRVMGDVWKGGAA